MGLQYLEEELATLEKMNERFGKWEDKLTDMLDNGQIVFVKLFEMIKKTPIDWDTLWITNSIATFTLDENADHFEYSLQFLILVLFSEILF